MIHRVLLALQKSGFVSAVIRGGPTAPVLLSPTSLESVEPPEPVTQANIASRRLWVGLKYYNNEPVLSKLKMMSKPTRRVHLNVEQLRQLVRGKNAAYVEGLSTPGECLYLTTDRGVLESRECVERDTGGMLICRVS